MVDGWLNLPARLPNCSFGDGFIVVSPDLRPSRSDSLISYTKIKPGESCGKISRYCEDYDWGRGAC